MSLINKSRALSIVNILIAGPNRQKKLGEMHFPLLNIYRSIFYTNKLKIIDLLRGIGEVEKGAF